MRKNRRRALLVQNKEGKLPAGAAIWQANSTKRIRDAKAPGALSVGACRNPAEAGLKFAADVLLGSFWRRFALRVAVQKLRNNPDLNVVLFDRILLGLQDNEPAKNLKKDGKCIRALVTRLLGETYMQQLANVTSRCVVGGVPGVGSDYDERSEKKQPCLSNIPMAPRYGMSENMRHVLNFYATHFGVQFHRDGADPKFGRGFALFCPDL